MDLIMEFLAALLGVTTSTLAVLLGAFVLAVGISCLPRDIAKPWAGGITGAPVDILLIVAGLLMTADALGWS